MVPSTYLELWKELRHVIDRYSKEKNPTNTRLVTTIRLVISNLFHPFLKLFVNACPFRIYNEKFEKKHEIHLKIS